MKRILYFTAAFLLIATTVLQAQQAQKGDKANTLISERIENQKKSLDEQYLSLTQRMEKIIKDYKLLETKDIRVVPYQTTYKLGPDYIMLERHTFIKDDLRPKEVSGIRTNNIKIYTNGSTISKLECEVYEKHYYSGDVDRVTIIDPSPTTGDSDDISFTHIRRGKYLLKDQKMKDVKNTTAYPIRNELMQQFMIPSISIFNNDLLVTAEGYYQSLKDTDEILSDFLKASIR